ncbi:MAG: phosphate ABC transporter substrate-binding protein [Melioribacteraceae bacterium]|nr:phosphate ABC transporter substrate-binding protein [Melioribacteraceae bacterium]
MNFHNKNIIGETMNNISKKLLGFALLLIVFSTSVMAQTVKVDENLPHYKKTTGIKGNLNSIGSDTILNMMTLWAEGFNGMYPEVKIQIEGKGSSTAPPALIEGTAQLGPMSRQMKAKEVDSFEEKFGYKPTPFSIALDALAVYVNKENPVKGLSFEQVDAVFSKTRKQGYSEEVTTWGQLGLKGEFAKKPISIFGRNSASGTYGYFKSHVLKKGDYKDVVKEQPGSASVVQGVAEDKFAIGYSGIGYKTSGVRVVPLSKKEGEEYFDGTNENVASGKYPLSRFLYVYIAKNPGKPVDPLVNEFMKYILSYEGQQVVVKDGYLPLSADVAKKMLEQLN